MYKDVLWTLALWACRGLSTHTHLNGRPRECSPSRARPQEVERLEKEAALERKVSDQLCNYLRKRASSKQENALDWGQKHEIDNTEMDRKIEALKNSHQKDLIKMKEVSER